MSYWVGDYDDRVDGYRIQDGDGHCVAYAAYLGGTGPAKKLAERIVSLLNGAPTPTVAAQGD